MSYYYIKLFLDVLDDPKMGSLSDSAWRLFVELVLYAKELNLNGWIPDVNKIKWRLRKLDTKRYSVTHLMDELVTQGIVQRNEDGSHNVTNFAKRQARMDASTRGKLYRSNHPEDAPQPTKQGESWASGLCEGVPYQPGIYKLMCAGSGRVYIGGTNNLQKRIRQHLSEMRSPGHRMSKDYKEYGEQSIEVEVLEVVNDIEILAEREKYYITLYPKDDMYNEEDGKNNRYWNKRNTNDTFGNPNTVFENPSTVEVEQEVEVEVVKNRVEAEVESNVAAAAANLETLKSFGIMPNKTILELAERADVTPDKIRANAARLQDEGRFTTGLLITALRCGDNPPKSKRKGQKDPGEYAKWEE